MYIPTNFRQTNIEEVKTFIRENGFAILISQVEDRPWATHIPLELETNAQGQAVLVGHLSRGNKQWKEFNADQEVLAIFQGSHAYISSSWYDHENVPTWNYIAVHVYGRIRIISGEELLASLKRLVDKYEAHSDKPVTVEGMSPKFLQRELQGVVGFEIRITDIQAAYKLSQNRDAKNKEQIIAQLEHRGDPESMKIAKHMKSYNS
jgi:transcriptional regulator